jgi:hypothetical protein
MRPSLAQWNKWAYERFDRIVKSSDLDIYRAAKLIVDQHGDEAALYATGRADQHLDEGDTAGTASWRRIM